MNVCIEFEAELRQLAGTDRITADLPEGSSVHSALQSAASASDSQITSRIFDEDGELRPSLLIFVNDQPLGPGPGPGTRQPLQDGDRILLLPPISGG